MSGAQELSDRQLGRVLKDLLDVHTSLVWNKRKREFTADISADYRDYLSAQTLKDITSSEDPMSVFYNYFEPIDTDSYERNALFNVTKDHWNTEKYGDHSDYAFEIIDWLDSHVIFNFPYDHFLNQDIEVNIIVNTGDANVDYTLNNLLGWGSYPEDTISENSSILWLVRQQGYTKTDLNNLIRKERTLGSKFLLSIFSECVNVASQINALTFLVKMTLKEFIDLKQNPRKITLSPETTCGLYDMWSGGGSLFEIALEKPVVIPAKYIRMEYDGTRKYSVSSVYGANSSMWTGEIVPNPKRKVAV